MDSLDNLANNIASATFDVINAGKVRTADMGGKFQSPIPNSRIWNSLSLILGSATTSEFTAAVIKNIQ